MFESVWLDVLLCVNPPSLSGGDVRVVTFGGSCVCTDTFDGKGFERSNLCLDETKRQ